MGKNKNKFNWKARQVVETDVNNSVTTEVDITEGYAGHYDECNQLVIPSKKRPTQKKKKTQTVTRLLSKNQRKRLEKVVDHKKKKENRASLLESLSQVQASPDVMSQLTSLSAVQTKGLKRHFSELEHGIEGKKRSRISNERMVSSVAGSKKERRLMTAANTKPTSIRDPNIVGFDELSEDSSDESNGDSADEETKMPSADPGIMKETALQEMTTIVDESSAEEGPSRESINGKDKLIVKEKETTIQSAKKGMDQKSSMSKLATFVPVYRKPEIQEARLKLPILAEEQEIMEAINDNSVVILAGETGSGKTTQVPQFLYEAGYASDGKLIGVTEPRRVAAIAMSRRVAEEMNLSSKEVSYLIRFEGNATPDTSIKFMTDGVLLKEIQSDFVLSRYGVVIIDEAHERSVYTDILIGLLSRIVPLRAKRGSPLKLIIMSATLRVQDFIGNTRLFKQPPPVITVQSRQFPVTVHFNRRTAEDYVVEAFRKACKIHTQLPEGGILIFVTGQQEVKSLVRKLQRTFPMGGKYRGFRRDSERTSEHEEDSELQRTLCTARRARKKRVCLPNIDLDQYPVLPEDNSDEDFLEEEGVISEPEDETVAGLATQQPMWVLPLYSLLPSNQQSKVFEPPPEGCRLCVVATNVAETSLTIPNIKYVVDSGRAKVRHYDRVTGVSAFKVGWASKAAANQRAGRAGRTAPGHCYRLYSSAVFNDEFDEFAAAEIQRRPVDDLLLQMKAMSIAKVVNFPFPSPPDTDQLQSAERRLILLGALEQPKGDDDWTSKVTPIGNAMAAFPVAPRFGKMLALSDQHNLLPYTVCMVAALSVQEVLLDTQQTAHMRRKWAGTGNSLLLGDPMVLLRAAGAAEYAGSRGRLEQFCESNGLRLKAILEMRKLRLQLTEQLNLNLPRLNLSVDPSMQPPSESQARLLRQILLSGMPDQVACKADPAQYQDPEERALWRRAYKCGDLEDPVFLHGSSVLRRELPDWLVYQEAFETNKLYLRGATAIEPEWLPLYAPSLCNLSAPLSNPPPRYIQNTGGLRCHVNGTFGRAGWVLPDMEIDFPSGLDCYKWFARFLLEGVVCTKIQKYAKNLLSTPATMVKTWANLQPRTDVLLKTLVSQQVDSKEKLLSAWETDSTFLLAAYQKWLPEALHNEVASIWPPI